MSQLLKQKSPQTTAQDYARNGYYIIATLMTASLLTGSLFTYLGSVNNYSQLFIISGFLYATIILDFWLLSLIRAGKTTLAMSFLISAFLVNVSIVPIFVQDLGSIIAIATMIVVIAVTGLSMPPKYSSLGMIIGVVSGIALFLLDINLENNRIAVTQLEIYTPYIVALLAIGFTVLFIRDFNKFSLRVKIALGILITGAITVSVLVAFGINRSNELTNYLLYQYKSSNNENVKQQIVNHTESTANQTNELFTILVNDINIISSYRANLEEQKDTLSQGAYWDATTRLVQLPEGQYRGIAADPAAIFIPSTVSVDAAIIADLNTTAYLDFYLLNYLKEHPEVTAVYFISKTGSTTYYPNINLANIVPSNFDPRTQPFYTISDPANGSKREPNWVNAYQDPGGQGLIVTLSSPVYSKDQFLGVIGIDVQLQKLSEKITDIKIGETGYAFLVNETGLILAMPPQGYSLFGLQAEDIPVNESPKQSIIGKSTPELQNSIARMINSHTGIETISFNGQNLYIAFSPLTAPNYRLGIIVPEKEFTADIIKSENETQNQIRNTLQNMTIILALLFIGAVGVSLFVGQVITRPLLRLTQTVETISKGNLAARANINVEAEDETGVLARAFSSMAERLSKNLANLEERVKERTDELQTANAMNARRAAQFEAVAQVAHTISSTQTLDILLPQITETISAEFNFYHVGIFLLDNHREFAILVAANSAGGKKMLERNHRLQVGETGIVGYVTNIGQPRVALDVGMDAAYFNNPNLPDTHSEIALPLRTGSDVFGALDVQSTETNAFSQEDINILSILADQVSTAIQNARSYQQSNEALAQAESASLQLSGQQWKHFLANQTVEGYYFNGVDTKAITASDKQRPHNLAIPLTLRGSHIGSIKLSALDPNREWSDDEISMVQAAAERTGLALENARLLLESQKRATKERTIGEISAKISGLTNLESILQTAIRELGNTLPNTDIAVQFKEDQETE